MNNKIPKSFENYAIISVFFLLYFSSAFSLSVLTGTVRLLMFAGLFVFIVFFGFLQKREGLNISVLSLILFLLAATSYLVNGEQIKSYTILTSYFIVAISFCMFIDFITFAKAYVKVLYFLAVCSLVLYFADLLALPIIQALPTTKNTLELSTHTMFFALSPINGRNQGLFWEPGAYQTYLNLALLMDIFIFKARKKSHITVFVLATITTFSSAGYIALILIMLAITVNSAIEDDKRKSTFIILLVFFVCIYVAGLIIKNYSPNLWHIVFGKLNVLLDGAIESDTSVGVRYDAIVTPLRLFFENPVFGVAPTKITDTFETLYGHTMITCTFVNWFAVFGVFYGAICVKSIINFAKYFSNKKIIIFFIVTVFLVIIISENYMLNPSIMIWSIYGLSYNSETRRSDNENTPNQHV